MNDLPMLAPPVLSSVVKGRPGEVLPCEREFYEAYDWSLNPYLTVSDAIAHIAEEVDKLGRAHRGWQINELTTNIFLLSSGVLNSIDEYLLGPTLRLPKPLVPSLVGRTAGESTGFQVSMISSRWSLACNALIRDPWSSRAGD
jgi:hypothetical protein